MSLAVACGWSLARSTGVAITAAPVSIWLERRMRAFAMPARKFAWGILLVPFLFPTLLSGYAYSGTALGLVGADLWRRFPPAIAATISEWLATHNHLVDEALLCALLVSKGVPVGTLLLRFAPRPPYSAMAWHCRKLAQGGSSSRICRIRDRWDYLRSGPARTILAATSLMFLVAFQEFELPSLLNRPAWTVWLFDAQVGGLSLIESLRAARWPVALQLVVVLPLWRILRRGGENHADDSPPEGASRVTAWRDGAYLLAALCLACLIPLALVGSETLRGLATISGNRSQMERLARETLAGFGFAVVSAWGAFQLAEWDSRAGSGLARLAKWLVPLLAIPGLFGPLALSLALVSVLQWPPLNPLYRTPVSIVLGLTLHLFPRALLLVGLLRTIDRSGARHVAALLGNADDRNRLRTAGDLHWRLGGAARFWTIALLTGWGYLELTVAYLLGPVTIVSVPVLLYNQMHFGKNAVLSAMTCLAVVVPVALFAAAAVLRPFVWRSFRR